jgi:hypothetical protein
LTASAWLDAVRAAAATRLAEYPFHAQVVRETRVKVRIEMGSDRFAVIVQGVLPDSETWQV